MPRKNTITSSDGEPVMVASMRPRPDAAEKPTPRADQHGRRTRFNEAAARCRGKTLHDLIVRIGAAAASMRPRPDAAEKRVRMQRERRIAPPLQ